MPWPVPEDPVSLVRFEIRAYRAGVRRDLARERPRGFSSHLAGSL